MTILGNNQKSVKISFTNKVRVSYDRENNKECYITNLPTVICSNKQDAERIQQRVNNLVNELSRELLK